MFLQEVPGRKTVFGGDNLVSVILDRLLDVVTEEVRVLREENGAIHATLGHPRLLSLERPIRMQAFDEFEHIDDKRCTSIDDGRAHDPFLFQCGLIDGDTCLNDIHGSPAK